MEIKECDEKRVMKKGKGSVGTPHGDKARRSCSVYALGGAAPRKQEGLRPLSMVVVSKEAGSRPMGIAVGRWRSLDGARWQPVAVESNRWSSGDRNR